MNWEIYNVKTFQHVLVDCSQVHCGDTGWGFNGWSYLGYEEIAYIIEHGSEICFNVGGFDCSYLSFSSVSSSFHGRFLPFVHISGSIVGNGGKDFGIEIIFWVWGLGDVVRHGMNCCNNWRGQDVEGRGDVEIVSAVGEV